MVALLIDRDCVRILVLSEWQLVKAVTLLFNMIMQTYADVALDSIAYSTFIKQKPSNGPCVCVERPVAASPSMAASGSFLPMQNCAKMALTV